MAVMSQPWLRMSLLLLHLFFSVVPFSSSQPQNIETFYPFDDTPSPPAPEPSTSNNPPILTPPTSPQLVPTPPTLSAPQSGSGSPSSNNKTIAKAVAATAASTLFIALLFFLAIQRYVIRKRQRVGDQNNYNTESRRPTVLPANEFTRFDGNLRGLIVDENGLDVLYWRKLEEDDKQKNFDREILNTPSGEAEKEQGIIDKFEAVQEVPLLRGKSSSSHIKIQPEDDDGDLNHYITAKPPPAPSVLKTIQERQPPILQLSNVPPSPPPPPPIQNNKSLAPTPPPPPPVPAKKSHAPPPLPPKGNGVGTSLKPPPGPKRSSSEGQVEASSGSENGQVKLKPLHWDKVNKNVEHSMVWDKIETGSFRFDGDLMEALFGYVATDRKSPTRERNSKNAASPNSQVILLDARKSQNTAIVLKSLGLTRKELLAAVLDGKELNAETLEKLTRVAPSKEEQSKILDFDGDPTRLADAESFHYHILRAVPSAYTRLNALLFKSNYDSEITQFKGTLRILELGCNELRTRGLLLKLLEAILKAGNRMNAGTARGNAQGFDLTALRKLSDVKSIDRKTTLLHFVVEEVVLAEGRRCVINRNRSLSRSSSRNSSSASETSTSKEDIEKEYVKLGLPVVGGISAEFSNAKKAATVDYDAFSGICSALSAQVAENRELVAQCAADGGGGFVKQTKGFLETAEKEISVLRDEQTRVMELVRKTTEYFQAKQHKAQPLQLFVIIKDFLGMVDQVCIQIARNMQKRNSRLTGTESSSPKSPPALRAVRFPNLPEHFLTDKSRSGSSESDSDSP